MNKHRVGLKTSTEDRIYNAVVNSILFLFIIIVSYPLVYILSASFSSPSAVTTGRVVLWPVEPSIEGYKAVFTHKRILTGYRNTIIYTVLGTVINVIITMVTAYPLSRKDMPLKGFFMFLFTFTMFFSGGLIPTYILVNSLGLVNTIWVMVIPGALSVYNMILARTFIVSGVPQELLDASQIDGCSDAKYFFKVILPLSKPVIAVITLYYAVGHWNSYFGALIYLNNRDLYPLQLILRSILVLNQVVLSEMDDPELVSARLGRAELLKYSLIVVSSLPVILFYPLAQKHFIKGVMIGSVKG